MAYLNEIDVGSLHSQDFNSEELNTDALFKLAETVSSQQLFDDPDQHEYEADKHMDYEPDLMPIDLGYNLDIAMKGDSNSWLFHRTLHKIFIKMNSPMTINVSHSRHPEPLFLRAMILFDNPNEMHLPVKRCANHSPRDLAVNDPAGKHILKCVSPFAIYYGREDGIVFKDRLSVTVPLGHGQRDECGNISVPITYEFACQNSCTSGINRKSTSIVFTLEDKYYKILGKNVVQFKVCSCPKRDADREQPSHSKRKSSNEPFPKGKRPKFTMKNSQPDNIKIEPDDSDTPSTPEDTNQPKLVDITLTVPVESAKHILKCAYNEITGQMAANPKSDPKFYQKIARNILKVEKNLENE